MTVVLGEGEFLVVFVFSRVHNPLPGDLVEGNPAKTVEGQKEGLSKKTARNDPIHTGGDHPVFP